MKTEFKSNLAVLKIVYSNSNDAHIYYPKHPSTTKPGVVRRHSLPFPRGTWSSRGKLCTSHVHSGLVVKRREKLLGLAKAQEPNPGFPPIGGWDWIGGLRGVSNLPSTSRVQKPPPIQTNQGTPYIFGIQNSLPRITHQGTPVPNRMTPK